VFLQRILAYVHIRFIVCA